jgi:hypothetical protein
MSSSSRYPTRLLTAVLVACAGSVVLAKTRAPTIFELAYGDLARDFDVPELCEKIGPDTVEHGPFFGHPQMQIRYVQSKCFYDLAVKRQDATLCLHVRTISTFGRSGSGVSNDACRFAIEARPASYGGTYPAALLLSVMGFSNGEIRKAFPDHPERDRSYEFMLGSFLDESRKDAIRARLARLPDFSRGDAEARRQVYAAMPHCASRLTRSFECRRLRCALERAQPGGLGCERELERERPDPWQ